MSDKNYAQSIAGDLYHMIQSAQEQGVNVDTGFRNQALSSPSMTLTYLFLGKDDLLQVPALPPQVKKQIRRSNALATLELRTAKGMQTVGIHLIWASAKACSAIESEAEMLDGIQVQGLGAFTNQLKTVMRNDIPRTVDQQNPAETGE